MRVTPVVAQAPLFCGPGQLLNMPMADQNLIKIPIWTDQRKKNERVKFSYLKIKILTKNPKLLAQVFKKRHNTIMNF
jgi:hypothetical protein